jgi:hypothetical protein
MESRRERALSTSPARKLFAFGLVAVGTIVFFVVAAAPAMAQAEAPSLAAVIDRLRNLLVGVLAAAATLFLTIGGLRYMAAGGDPGQGRTPRGCRRLRPGCAGAGDRHHPPLGGGPVTPSGAGRGIFVLLGSCAVVALAAPTAAAGPTFKAAPVSAPLLPTGMSPSTAPAGTVDPNPAAPPVTAPPPALDVPPAPSSSATSVPLQDPEQDTPGFFDFGGRVRQAINDWFRDLVLSALDPALDFLGSTVLATPAVAGQGRVRELWGISAGMANGFFVILVILAGAIVMGYETVQSSYSVKEMAPRVVLGVLAANASLLVAGLAIDLANALSQAFLGQRIEPASATGTMRVLVLTAIAGGGTFLVLIALAVAVLVLLLVAIWVIRVSLVVVLVAGAPLALACHALPQTEGAAQLWWRALAACLGIQVAQSLVLITALRVFFDPAGRAALGLSMGGSLVDLVVVACLLWVMLRIPVWAGRAVFGRRAHSTLRLVKGYVVYKVLRRASAAVAA